MLRITSMTIGETPRGPFLEIATNLKLHLKKFARFDHRTYKNETTLTESLPKDAFLVVLDADGKSFDSKSFANEVERWEDSGLHVAIVLGGPHGLSDSFKKRANLLLSLSPMTTTHDLAHLFYLEQLYRACSIVKGMKYHY